MEDDEYASKDKCARLTIKTPPEIGIDGYIMGDECTFQGNMEGHTASFNALLSSGNA
jgi:hypothetical protein